MTGGNKYPIKENNMAYNNGNRATNQGLQRTAAPSNPVGELKAIANSSAMINRFKQVIGDKAPQFLASVVSAVSTNPQLLKANPTSIMASAMIAATLDLDINPSLGFAALVPYNKNTPIKDEHGNIVRWEKTTDAQFQIMTKGLVQLAIRSGQYKNINVTEVYEDEFESVDIISGDLKMHPVSDGQRSRGETGMIVGYVAYIRLSSGFEKTIYWPLEKIIQHAARFSKSYDTKTGGFRKGSAWADNFEAMCRKTVLKNALSSWGILSIQMQKAIVSDYSVSDFDTTDYPDGQEGDDLTSPTHKDVEGNSEPIDGTTLPSSKKTHAPKKTQDKVEPDAEIPEYEPLFVDDEQAELDRLWGAS